jgi:hypothetical protein
MVLIISKVKNINFLDLEHSNWPAAKNYEILARWFPHPNTKCTKISTKPAKSSAKGPPPSSHPDPAASPLPTQIPSKSRAPMLGPLPSTPPRPCSSPAFGPDTAAQAITRAGEGEQDHVREEYKAERQQTAG